MSATGLGAEDRRRAAIFASVAKIKDVVAEAGRRWPDLEWEDQFEYNLAGIPIKRLITGRWTRGGQECGLRTDVPIEATEDDLRDAREQIAFHALYRAELRKAGLA